jgi:hypothetical protein
MRRESFLVNKILKNRLNLNLGILTLMLSLRGQPPSQNLDSDHGMDSNDQTELSRYKRLYSQASEDLDNIKGQAKRRSVQTHSPAIFAYRNNFIGKLQAGHNWDVAYASSSLSLMIYQQSSTSMTYTTSYVTA